MKYSKVATLCLSAYACDVGTADITGIGQRDRESVMCERERERERER